MSKKIAVYIRGHLRTWDYIKEMNFNFFDSLPWDVDFYLATWEYSPKTLSRLGKDFKNRNLKGIEIFKRADHYNPWTGPASMSTRLSKLRIQEQLANNVEYEFIIETRFDVFLKLLKTPTTPNENSFGVTETTGQFQDKVKEIITGLSDHCFLSKPSPHAIMNLRQLISAGEDGNHITLYKLAKLYNINIFRIDWFDAIISRPNIVDSLENFSETCHELRNKWNNLSIDQKMIYVTKANIDPYDYAESYHVGNLLGKNHEA